MRDIAAELDGVALFGGLDAAQLAAVVRHAFVRRLTRGQILFTAGEPSQHLFVVRSGRLRVFATSPHGEELVLSVLGPGETLGELSVLDREPRSATVEALEAVQVIAVAIEEMRDLLDSNPAALRAVALALAASVRRLSTTAADLVFLDLPRRLAKLLLSESVPRADGTMESRLAMNQTGVAARLGVTRQSLNRAMSALGHRGWVATDGTTVQLVDTDALARFANS